MIAFRTVTLLAFVALVALVACGGLLAGPAALADVAAAAAAQPATRIEVDDTTRPSATVADGGQVVFHNGADSSTRIVFASRDAVAFDCAVDGDAVVRSRRSQYLLRAGAELRCQVRPGRYRYTTLTHQRSGVQRTKSTLQVRN